MPPIIALVVGLGIAGAAGGAMAAGTVFMIGTFTVSLSAVLMMGASMVLSGVMGFISSAQASSVTTDTANHSVNVKQAIVPRYVIYGLSSNAGVETYVATTGTKAKYLHMVLTFTGQPVDSIVSLYANDVKMAVDGAGLVWSGGYSGKMLVEIKLGHPGEPAFPGLVADTASLGAGAWTASCRQDGCCSIHVRYEYDATVWASGIPTIRAVIKGKNNIYDPRTGLSGWSNNAALCVRDYLMDARFGFRASLARVNDSSMIAAANLADEAVPIAAVNGLSYGSTEPRYTVNGGFDTSKTKGDVLKGMLSAGAGKASWIAGQWNVFLGAWRGVSLLLEDDDFRGALQLTGKVARRDRFNAVKGMFVNPLNNWQSSNCPPLLLASYVADDSGVVNTIERGYWSTGAVYAAAHAVISSGYAYVCSTAHTASADNQPGTGANWAAYWTAVTELVWQTFEYPFTISHATAQRLNRIALVGSRFEQQLVAPAKLGAYVAQPADVVAITHSHWGFNQKTFELLKPTLQIGAQDTGVDLTLRETDPTIYAWSVAQEQAMTGFTVQPSAHDPSAVAVPGNFQAISGAATALTRGDGIKLSRVELLWDQPDDAFVVSGGKICVEYAPSPGTQDLHLSNPNFVDGANGWTLQAGWAVIPIIPFSGCSNGACFTGSTAAFVCNQRFACTPGAVIGVACEVTGVEGADGTAAPRVYFYKSDGTDITYMSGGPSPANVGWSGAWVRATAPAGTAYAGVGFAVGGRTVGKWYVTAFSAYSSWVPLAEVDGALTSYYVGGVSDGVSYDFRIRARNVYGAYSAYNTLTGHVVSSSLSHITQAALSAITIGNRNSAIVGGGSPLSARWVSAGSATIDVAAFQLQTGYGVVSYNAGSISGLGISVLYYVFTNDPLMHGGAVAYQASADFTTVVASMDNVFVGYITTPDYVAGVPGTPTSGDGGGGCCTVESFVDDTRLIDGLAVGELLETHEGAGHTAQSAIERADAPRLLPCCELTAANGVRWRGSLDTPIVSEDGSYVRATWSKGVRPLTKRRVDGEWLYEYSEIVSVTPLGFCWVRLLYLGGREYAAGVDPDGLMFTHNMAKIILPHGGA